MRELTDKQCRELVAAKVAAAEVVMADEVARLVTGEDWRRFLGDQARFFDLDAHNVLLVVAQHRSAYEQGRVPDPSPTYVASFDTWKALGRRVERGQHGYTTLTLVRTSGQDAQDSAGEVKPHPPARREWRPETLFALSQTAGKIVVEAPRARLGPGDAPPGLKEAVVQLVEARGWKVTTTLDAASPDGLDSHTSYVGRRVTVRADLDDAAVLKALVHQAAHVFLHPWPPGRYVPQAVKEVEADSVAYVVAAVHGMPTDGWRFPSVASWAGEEKERALRASGARISRAARAIIAASPAKHSSGSKPPGADLALATMRRIDQEVDARMDALLRRMARNDEIPASPGTDGPEVA